MGMSQLNPVADKRGRIQTLIGLLLTGAALLAHLLAANAIGGTRVDYTDHVAGFFMILIASGAIIAGLGWRYWKANAGALLLWIGVVQAVFGLAIGKNEGQSTVSQHLNNNEYRRYRGQVLRRASSYCARRKTRPRFVVSFPLQ